MIYVYFFFNDTATTEIYTLSLHDALPISTHHPGVEAGPRHRPGTLPALRDGAGAAHVAGHLWPRLEGFLVDARSEEHTSELQSQSNLVCRLLLEKKKKILAAEAETVG